MSAVKERYEITDTLEHSVSRKAYTIMLAGLYAQLFRRFPTPATLTRWADLEEELMQL